MKTVVRARANFRLAGLAAVIAGFALAIPAAVAEAQPGDTCAKQSCAQCCMAKSSQAKVAKPAKVSKQTKQKAKPAKKEVTGSRLKQRVAVERFPETTSPVEIMDRRVIARSGEATLGGFLGRQSIFR